MEEYRLVYKGGQGEVVEKKSRFIANVAGAYSEEEALSFIAAMKKKYWDASHNCYAYVTGEQAEIQRFSDDREPSGTAGKPILEVLLKEGISNAAIVVTRYFGGTLLGTGGLIRAYSKAAREGLASSFIIARIQGVKLLITTEYTNLGKIQHILSTCGLCPADVRYTDKVQIQVLVPGGSLEKTKVSLNESTNGQVELQEEACAFAEIEGGYKILE